MACSEPLTDPRVAVARLLLFVPGVDTHSAARILQLDTPCTEAALAGLQSMGWAEPSHAPVRGRESLVLWFLTPAAEDRLAAVVPEPRRRSLALGPEERLVRLADPARTYGVSRVLAGIGEGAARRAPLLGIHLQTFPWQSRQGGDVWPAGALAVAAFQIRDESSGATKRLLPVYLTVDQAQWSDAKRASLVRQWMVFYQRVAQRLVGPSANPDAWDPVGVVLCLTASPVELEAYLRLFRDQETRWQYHRQPKFHVALRTDAVADPWDRCWWQGVDTCRNLDSVIQWAPSVAPRALPFPSAPPVDLAELPRAAARPTGTPRLPRRLVQAAALDLSHRAVMGALADLPLLSPDELAQITGERPTVVTEIIEDLTRDGLVIEPLAGRFALTKTGSAVAAAWGRGRASVGAKVPEDGGPGPGRRLAHDLGVRGFLARLATDLRAANGRVESMREQPTCAYEFSWKWRSLFPDAVLAVIYADRRWLVYLEWDTGSTTQGDLAAKWKAYERYFLWRLNGPVNWCLAGMVNPTVPLVLLLVTSGPKREEEVWARIPDPTAKTWVRTCLRTTHVDLLEAHGPLGPIWRDETGHRGPWARHAVDVVATGPSHTPDRATRDNQHP